MLKQFSSGLDHCDVFGREELMLGYKPYSRYLTWELLIVFGLYHIGFSLILINRDTFRRWVTQRNEKCKKKSMVIVATNFRELNINVQTIDVNFTALRLFKMHGKATVLIIEREHWRTPSFLMTKEVERVVPRYASTPPTRKILYGLNRSTNVSSTSQLPGRTIRLHP